MAVGAYLLWGLLPVYLKLVSTVAATEVLAHRVVWAVAALAIVLTAMRGWSSVRQSLNRWRTVRWLFVSASIIAANWGVFIWAVGEGRIVECSLGYFINPLISVLLAVAILKERLSRGEALALGCALLGVGYEVAMFGAVPWIALTLAVSFGVYALLRKLAPAGPIDGLFVETLLMAPVALAYLAWLTAAGQGHFLRSEPATDILLLLAGPVTAAPLLLFVAAARRIRLTTIGILQYLAPTIHLLLAVFAYGEPFTLDRLVTFGFVWLGLVFYSVNALAQSRTA